MRESIPPDDSKTLPPNPTLMDVAMLVFRLIQEDPTLPGPFVFDYFIGFDAGALSWLINELWTNARSEFALFVSVDHGAVVNFALLLVEKGALPPVTVKSSAENSRFFLRVIQLRQIKISGS
jgi:hypothetical protein